MFDRVWCLHQAIYAWDGKKVRCAIGILVVVLMVVELVCFVGWEVPPQPFVILFPFYNELSICSQ
jgi:hypothetical protein